MKKSKIVMIVLLIVISVMATAYSIFASQLTINGESEIVGEWNVKITGIEATEVSDGCDAGVPEFTDTTATFSADLEKLGDTIVYEVTIENAGTIDATLSSANFTPDDENGSPAIIYSTTDPSKELVAGGKTSFTITITYDENSTEIPSIKTKKITGVINYVQK